MTITIHRPTSTQRLALSLGLAAILVAAAFVVFQITGTDPSSAEGLNVSGAAAAVTSIADPWKALQAQQDSYLPDTVQPAPTNQWKALQAQQDSYLPDTVQPAPAEDTGLDNRTGRPR